MNYFILGFVVACVALAAVLFSRNGSYFKARAKFEVLATNFNIPPEWGSLEEKSAYIIAKVLDDYYRSRKIYLAGAEESETVYAAYLCSMLSHPLSLFLGVSNSAINREVVQLIYGIEAANKGLQLVISRSELFASLEPIVAQHFREQPNPLLLNLVLELKLDGLIRVCNTLADPYDVMDEVRRQVARA